MEYFRDHSIFVPLCSYILNSSIDPIIYAYRVKEIGDPIKRILRILCCRKSQQQTEPSRETVEISKSTQC